MEKFLKKVKKGVKKMLNIPLELCMKLKDDKEFRMLTSLVLMGIGGALFASLYIRVPE